ncbi:MAG: domain containing protein [Marmoricola sp.]|nr:domain containing protein [Marmoricola sp.]
MLVQDLMTRQPITITGDWRVKEAATLAAEHRVSALPVIDVHGRVRGIVTEADLIRDAFGHDVRAHERPQADSRRTPAVLVSQVMTSPAVTVRERADLAEVVDLMTSARLKSLPVVDGRGRVVGMVSRSDVVRVRARADETLEQEVAAMLLSLEHRDWQVEVHDGVAEIAGPDTPLDRSIALVAANTVAGVVAVRVN